MNNREFVSKLYFDKKFKDLLSTYGEILGKIFDNVKEYKDAYNIATIIVNEEFNGKYKTLGEYFKNNRVHGIFNVWPEKIITNAGFDIYLYDDRLVVVDTEFNDNIYSSLMKPEYQKKYVAEMYKIFGEPYKKHYKELIQEKRSQLEQEAEYLKW